MEPDAIIQNGIKVLQNKLAAVIQNLTASDANGNGNAAGNYDEFGADDGMNGAQPWQGQGYTTPYGNNGDASWTAGAATPYGATPYGQSGYSLSGTKHEISKMRKSSSVYTNLHKGFRRWWKSLGQGSG